MEELWITELYNNYFGTARECKSPELRALYDKGGADRIFKTSGGILLRIQEKIRGKTYEPLDVALEIEHVFETGKVKKGWAQLTLMCDFFTYLRKDRRCGLIFPYAPFKLALAQNLAQWEQQYPKKPAHNGGYNPYDSWSVFVPEEVVIAAVQNAVTELDWNLRADPQIPGVQHKPGFILELLY